MVSKIVMQTLKEIDGSEMYFEDRLILLEYPFIWQEGKKFKPSEKKWKKIYDAYWNDSNNEGYWMKKDVEAGFSHLKKKYSRRE